MTEVLSAGSDIFGWYARIILALAFLCLVWWIGCEVCRLIRQNKGAGAVSRLSANLAILGEINRWVFCIALFGPVGIFAQDIVREAWQAGGKKRKQLVVFLVGWIVFLCVARALVQSFL